MVLSLTIVGITILFFLLSVLFFPSLKLGKVSLSTYWMIILLGAILLLSLKCVDIKEVISSFTFDSGINPLKILVLFLGQFCLSSLMNRGSFPIWQNILQDASRRISSCFSSAFISLSLSWLSLLQTISSSLPLLPSSVIFVNGARYLLFLIW